MIVLSLEVSLLNLILYTSFLGISLLGFETIQVNTIVLSTCQLFGFIAALVFVGMISRRLSSLIGLLGILMVTLVIIAVKIFNLKETNEQAYIIIELMVVIVLNLMSSWQFVIFFIKLGELFPPNIRGSAIGIVNLVGNMTAALSGFCIEYSEMWGFNIFFLSVLPSLIVLPLSMTLPETKI